MCGKLLNGNVLAHHSRVCICDVIPGIQTAADVWQVKLFSMAGPRAPIVFFDCFMWEFECGRLPSGSCTVLADQSDGSGNSGATL